MRFRSSLIFAVLGAASLLRAQSTDGSLRGVVRDGTGARVACSSVDVVANGSVSRRSATCSERGVFRVEGLAPGDYSVTVHAAGFADASAALRIVLGTTRQMMVTMQPGSVRQTVSVTGQAGLGSSITTQPLDRSSAVHQSVITSRDLATLPLAERSFANIAYLAPGTEPVEPSDPTKARITAVSTGGSSGLNNELSVDGGDNSDDFIGGFLQNYSPDAIREFSVRTAQEDANTGGTTAGSVVILTKSGTNEWHGDEAFYERAAALNARYPIENPAPNPKQPFSRQNYIATLGGPVRKDRLWFFASYEQVHEDASIAYSPASVTQFDALSTLAAEGLIPGVGAIPVPANVPVPFRDYLGLLRLDWAQSQRSDWVLRGAIDNYTTHNNLVQQGTLPSTGLLTHNNYLNLVLSNQFQLSSTWLANFVFSAGGLHLTQVRNSNLGFALAFPFSSTSLTVSGYETFGDNQFATPITFFPSERNQEKYQWRYDVMNTRTNHSVAFGVNFIHEPVLDGAFPSNDETLYQFPQNPDYYLSHPAQFATDRSAGATTSNLGGGFAQNIQRLALYAQDSWQARPQLVLNYGLRYSTTFGLFEGSGRSQLENPGYRTLQALGIPLVTGAPQDDRAQVAPRIGIAYTPGKGGGNTVLRAGFGLFFEDLAQGGWATAFQAVNTPSAACVDPLQGAADNGCVPGSAAGGHANLIDPHYRTPYAIHVSAGLEHWFGKGWAASADYTHEQGNHSYRGYSYTGGVNLLTPLLPDSSPEQAAVVPDASIFHSDNRSSYNALMLHVQGNVTGRLNLVANYTLASAKTWGCVLGELFDYVNGVCNPLQPFGPGDYGPSGEDVRHRVAVAGTLTLPGKVMLSTLTQAETARPFTITTADNSGRIAVNGVPTSLDQFRGTPYVQADLRVSRPTRLRENWSLIPFAEFFNLLNRNNPGANYVTNLAALPVPADVAASGNVTAVCANAACTASQPISSLNQLRVAGGALGDFFGPGTTVGIPFAAQLGMRLTF
ncbi:TonB-dependent receptor [Acidipila rosea]|uniref:Carboxypeptidase family protein n=1 Tax=Acidipila rosea TaxID=768535 RepID=A0A4R1L7H5_9BACT|nr:carboxypeptidase regulatory-like domain-containing protein [Acidipila rosea]TCK74188.1 carboxypeptidase family protein [Acidipila rosea]